MSFPEMRPMGVGEVLDRSFQTLRRHFGVLFATSVIGLSPILLLYLVMGNPGMMVSPETGMPTFSPTFFVLMLAGMLMGAVLWAALTAEVDGDATGGPVTVGDGLGTGFRMLLRMIGAGILVYLAALGLLIPVGIVAFLVSLVGALIGSTVVMTVLMGLGFAVPGVVAGVVWLSLTFLIAPALVIEKLGPVKALRRANELAKGGRLRVCATSILAYLVMLLPTLGLPFVLGMGAMLWSPQAAGQVSTIQLYIYEVVMIGVSAITTPFMVAAMVFTYYDRRVRREGFDVELASESVEASV